jgi:hypothetical protein
MKMDILRDAHYIYNFDQELFVNPNSRKAFSFPFIDDHSEKELADRINEMTEGQGWRFYFNVPPPERMKRELEKVLG